MKLRVNNQEFIFDNVIQRNNCIIFWDSLSDLNVNDHILSSKYELKIKFVKDMLENSLKNYINFNNSYEKSIKLIKEYFSYFKLTSNFIVKKDMVSKISNILINSKNYEKLIKNIEIKEIIKSYYKKGDTYYNFLLLMLKQKNHFIYEVLKFNENDQFDILDFILDNQ